MKRINAVIVDDEKNGIDNLKGMLIKHTQNVHIIGEAGNLFDAEELLVNAKERPDVAFLDINMSAGGTIFRLLQKIRDKIDFEIIFVSGEEKFAIEACSYSSIAFILKPIDPEKLIDAVNRLGKVGKNTIKERLDIFDEHQKSPKSFDRISISDQDGIHFFDIKDIVRLEGEDNYTVIHFNDKTKLTISKTLKSYERLFSHIAFYRVHKSHVININYMVRFIKGKGAGSYVEMKDGSKIDVSRRRKTAFLARLKSLE